MTWNDSETRNLIEELFGREQLELARPALRSIVNRLAYAQYHFQEAERLQEIFCDQHLTKRSLIQVAFSVNSDAHLALNELMLEIGAHTIACIQSIHTLPDIFAHALYFSLGLNMGITTALKELDIVPTSVCKLLKTNEEYLELAIELDRLKNQGRFDHINALANHSKHRSIVQPKLNGDNTGTRERRYEIHFSEFTYRDKPYPAIDIHDFLEPEYARCSKIVLDTGVKLKRVLEKMLQHAND